MSEWVLKMIIGRNVIGDCVTILSLFQISLIELHIVWEEDTIDFLISVELKGSNCTGIGWTEGVHTSLTAFIEEERVRALKG